MSTQLPDDLPTDDIEVSPIADQVPEIIADWSSSHIANEYSEAGGHVEIDRDEGVLQTPICDDPGTFGNNDAPNCGIVQMYAPCAIKRVEFVASRAGAKPEIPQPVPTSSNEVLSKFVTRVLNPRMSIDGKTRIFRIHVLIEYLLRKAPDTASGYPGMRAPFDNTSPETYNLNTGDFDDNAVAST